MTTSRFASKKETFRHAPSAGPQCDGALAAAVTCRPAAAKTDSHGLKLVPFVTSTDASKLHRRAKSENVGESRTRWPPAREGAALHPFQFARSGRLLGRTTRPRKGPFTGCVTSHGFPRQSTGQRRRLMLNPDSAFRLKAERRTHAERYLAPSIATFNSAVAVAALDRRASYSLGANGR